MRLLVVLLTLLLYPAFSAAEALVGRVVKVVVGDTVYVLDANQEKHKIRLGGIDAPERGQPFGKRCKERMAELVAGQDVTVNWHKKDRWGWLIGAVWIASPDCTLPEDPQRRSRLDHVGVGLALQAVRTRAV